MNRADEYNQSQNRVKRHQRDEREISLSNIANQPEFTPRKNGGAKRVFKIITRVIVLFIVFLMIAAIAGFIWFRSFVKDIDQKLDRKELDYKDLGISSVYDDSKYKDVKNIVLLGLDRRNSEYCRSDVIIVLTVDKKNNILKTSSLLRDAAVSIDGQDTLDKLGHAYAYGGAQLAIKTINKNFDLNVTDYIALDFDSMAKVVDVIGAVEVDVKENEIENANKNISEYAYVFEIDNPTYIPKTGLQKLNGMQACGYSRVRYDGTGDDRNRTTRQRTVIEAAFKNMKEKSIFDYPAVAKQLAPIVETSMSADDAVSLAVSLLTGKNKATFAQARFPMDSDLSFETVNDTSMAVYNSEITLKKIHGFVYDNISPEDDE